ncbi:MAG: hypothetical protein JWN70_4856 [Planctomycetaceae bacterium]|nr:hypothetical protein [Planctomycetaceae bacterium]
MKNRLSIRVRPSRRRGLATLEFVMSLPFLLAAFAVIIAVAMASIKKSEAAIAARNHAWEQRETGNGEQPFVLPGAGTDGQQNSDETQQFTLPPPPVSTGQTATAESKNQILTGSWSDPLAEMSKEEPDFVPHFKPMGAMATQGMVSFGPVEQLAERLSDLPGGGGVGAASKAMNGVLYAAGLVFEGLAGFTDLVSQFSGPIEAIADAADLLDKVDEFTPDFLIEGAEKLLGENGLGSIKEAKDAAKKAGKVVETLLNLGNRIQAIFAALHKASIGEDYKPDPAGLPIDELKQLVGG